MYGLLMTGVMDRYISTNSWFYSNSTLRSLHVHLHGSKYKLYCWLWLFRRFYIFQIPCARDNNLLLKDSAKQPISVQLLLSPEAFWWLRVIGFLARVQIKLSHPPPPVKGVCDEWDKIPGATKSEFHSDPPHELYRQVRARISTSAFKVSTLIL